MPRCPLDHGDSVANKASNPLASWSSAIGTRMGGDKYEEYSEI